MKKKEMIQELKGDIAELKELVSNLSDEITQLRCNIDVLNLNYYPVYAPQPIEPGQPDIVRWGFNGSTTAVPSWWQGYHPQWQSGVE